MQLNQPIPPTDAGGSNPYDFILNGNQKPKKSLVPLPTGNSRKQRTILIAGGGAALLVVIVIVFILISSIGSGTYKPLVAIAQDQTEIITISSDGQDNARGTTAQNYAATVNASLTTGQQQTVKYLAGKRQKVDSKTLALGHSAQTEAALKSAQTAGRYDDEVIKTLNKELADYKVAVSKAFSQAKNASEKKLLQQLYDQIQILTKNQPTSS